MTGKPKGWFDCPFLRREVIDEYSNRLLYTCLRSPCEDKSMGYRVCDDEYCPRFIGVIGSVVDSGITRIRVKE